MDLNGLSPKETFTVARDSQPRVAQTGREVAGDTAEEPLSAPIHDGVLASFEASRSDDSDDNDTRSTKEGDAQALFQQSVRDRLTSLLSDRLPTNATLHIDVDPDTQDARFLVRNRDTGDVVREIPERELTELLREGLTASGTFVDRTL